MSVVLYCLTNQRCFRSPKMHTGWYHSACLPTEIHEEVDDVEKVIISLHLVGTASLNLPHCSTFVSLQHTTCTSYSLES